MAKKRKPSSSITSTASQQTGTTNGSRDRKPKPSPSISQKTLNPWMVIGVAVVAGVLSFLVGFAASNVYFRLVDIGNSPELRSIFGSHRELTSLNRLFGQYAFCNVLQWLLETRSWVHAEIALIPAFSFVFVFLLAIISMPRSMWTRQSSVKIAVIASTVHCVCVCIMLILWRTVFHDQLLIFETSTETGWRIYRGELTGWLPMAMVVTLMWNAFLGAIIGGILGWVLEVLRLNESSSTATQPT